MESFSQILCILGVTRWLLPPAQRGSDAFLSFLSLGLCSVAWTDGQTGWLGLPEEDKGLSFQPESILTQQDISLTHDLSIIFF